MNAPRLPAPLQPPTRFRAGALSAALGPGWQRAGNAHAFAIGQASLDGEALDAAAIAQRLSLLASEAEFDQLLHRLNGCFAVAVMIDDRLLAAVDRVRSYPLFHRSDRDGAPMVADLPEALFEEASHAMLAVDERAAAEFRLTGYVTGADTLLVGLRQLQAGHRLIWRPGQPPQLHEYHGFRHPAAADDDADALCDRLHGVHARVFERLLRSLGGRRIVLPLSGGYDSRLIAVGLKEAGARDVRCFSYGTAANWEMQTARELAEHLGYAWTSVDYTPPRWRAVMGAGWLPALYRHAGRLVSVPHLQDLPAIESLRSGGWLGSDDVLVPGHTGDFITGGHVPLSFKPGSRVDAARFADAVIGKHYALWTGAKRDSFAPRILALAQFERPDAAAERAADAFEYWESQERQAKFICNSVRSYEFFGLGWRMPLWDAELMDFWSAVPLALRLERRLYRRYVARHQRLPIREPNIDRAVPSRLVIAGLKACGAISAARAARVHWRRLNWRREHAACSDAPLAWFSGLDADWFGRLYSGRENLHAFVTLLYLDQVRADAGAGSTAAAR